MRKKAKPQSSMLWVFVVLLVVAIILVSRRPRGQFQSARRTVMWRNPLVSEVRLRPPAPPLQPRVWEAFPPSTYQTVGFLENGTETRPLLARRSHTRRHRWHYSTTNDANSSISQLRLPVSSVAQNKKCTSEIGCEELYDGDTVTVPGSPTPMRVQLYEKHFG